MRSEFWTLILLHLVRASITSDCDVEFTYSEYYNSNGFKVTCRDIEEGQEDIIRYISAQNAIILDIKNTTLVNVRSDLFENVPKLKELNIEDSRIYVDGTVDLFSKLESLQTLVMKNTVVERIGNGTFHNLLQLRTLHLENNTLSLMPKDSLKLYTLDSLLFINNNLENVDDIPLCFLENIERINLSKNRIKTLKPDLYQCSPKKATKSSLNSLYENNHLSVESLDLSDNRITSITNAFTSFTNLNFLYLANNSISRLTDTDFENLFELEELNLRNNSISSVSLATFTKLISLREIDLSHNKIARLQLQFLTKLTKVDLSHNKLTFENMDEVKYLPFLETLDLSYNKLKRTEDFFNEFPSLVNLNLNGNSLMLTEDMFRNLSQLETLFLRGNGITHLPGRIFNNMTSLKELDLSENKLEVIENYEIFSSLFSLQVFNLSYNNLRYLNHNLFSSLDDCEVLDIAGNKLRDLDYPYIINSMRSLDTLNLNNNLFSCNFLHKLVRYFSWKNIKYNVDNMTQYDEENIGGIHCQEEIASVVEAVKRNPDSTSVFVITLIAAIFSVFILLVILIVKYYQIYKRSKYHSEQFELISE
ncbi:carboxypeptidase N subunit 2-like [Coccinella septempunctata]|uniref:carboxypeptidase N subunit 2-like n=1 Tax=Coccinella septempunctata TaxID=41139 RepID=UPI001D072F1D|nr:carboxypeptidase N subunit 2-like [Coccinella septempunctata]XP_044755388.1 carboxypeptidase N subunit 2-like [Coccinella septempunctata]XP_044755394.1 carboxypeptidase N subunit 2-like [Coccinella septempunctata]